MSTVRKLVLSDHGWEVETLPWQEPPSGTLPITMDTVLVPPQAGDHGFWAGHTALSPATRYIGWGPAMDNLPVTEDDLQAAPQGYDDALSAALSLPACAIALALERFTPALTVGVVGQGLLADLARDILAHRGFTLQDPEPNADLELLVDTEGEPGLWARSLTALRAHGTLLLFVPPWSRPVSFDFYSQTHRRSLQVMATRWHCLPHSSALVPLDYLPPIVSRVVRESRWLRPLNVKNAVIQTEVWQWLNWTSRGATPKQTLGL